MASPLNLSTDTNSDLTPLYQQIARRADLNQDGSVSISEFASFLQSVLSAVSTSSTAAATTTRSLTATTTKPTLAVTAANLAPCMPGWDPVKWANLSHATPKYVIGRVLANYPPTPAGLADAVPALQAAMPGVTYLGKDKLDVPGVGVVDVGVAFGAGGGVAWGWMPIEAS